MDKKRFSVLVLFLLLVGLFGGALEIKEAKATTTTTTFTAMDESAFIRNNTAGAYDALTGEIRDLPDHIMIGTHSFGPNWERHRAFLFFNKTTLETSIIITSAILSVRVIASEGNPNFNFTIMNGQPTYPHLPLQTSDYYRGYYSGNGGSRNVTDFLGYESWWNVSLNSLGIGWINKDNVTKLCIVSSEEFNGENNGEWIAFGSEWTNYEPKLYIVYETGEPTNDALTLTNPSVDTKGCLAQKQAYIFQTKISDPHGGTNLNYVQIYLAPTQINIQYRWTENTDTFSEQYDPNGYASISSTSADSSLSGNQWTLNFKITFSWSYPDDNDHNVKVYSIDDYGLSDNDTYPYIYYVQSVLVASSLSVNDYRVNPSQTLNLSGYLYYKYTSIYPPNGDYQVKIKLGGVQKGSTDTTLVNGFFAVSDATAETTVNAYSYYVTANYMAVGSWYFFSDVVVDKIQVTISANNTYPMTSETVEFSVSAIYAYSGSPISSWSFQITRNGSNYATSTPFTDMRVSYGLWVYTTSSASETTYGLNTFTTNTLNIIWGRRYYFYGVYDEDSGILEPPSERAVNVNAYFTAGNYFSFTLNGTYTYTPSEQPLYFRYLFPNPREYWLSTDEQTSSFYVFNATTETYIISFLDLAGILKDYPYVSAKRYINGTLMTIEKRKVDVESKVVMSLRQDEQYTLVLGSDGLTYIFGDLTTTSVTVIQLTLRGVDFPKETLYMCKYVRIYATRKLGVPYGNITVTYQDTLNQTYNVHINIMYRNGTSIWNYTTTAQSFIYTWTYALNNTDYWVELTVTHAMYGTYPWRQYFPRSFSQAPWGFGWLGSLPFGTSWIFPALLILAVMGCFSVINAPAGAILGVGMACILTYVGWIPIPAGALITAFSLAILMALIYAKRRITY